MTTYKMELTQRPNPILDGDMAFPVPKIWVEKNDERAVTFSFICHRRLFGRCYRNLVPDVYEKLGKQSGVMIAPLVPTVALVKGVSFPGDIDLLIIPYDGNDLLLSEALGIEIKVVRAKFAKQGKAPNEFGFSQGSALLSLGIPYAAVAHLIVSDSSPVDHWRKMHAAQVINAETGELGGLTEVVADMLPADLIDRCFGRLTANCSSDLLGLISAYVLFGDDGFWTPMSRQATKNSHISPTFMTGLERFYTQNYQHFLDTPKYPPRQASLNLSSL